MSNYHTKALVDADIFTIMGSIYAEVARYDSAVTAKQFDLAEQAAARAQEIMDYSQSLKQINHAQKLEIKKFNDVFDQQAKQIKKSELDNYLLPFATQARLRQFS